MTRDELAISARRFLGVLEGLEFKAVTYEHKDKDKDDKVVSKPTHEVRRGAQFIFNADTEEEAEACAENINNLVSPFIRDEFNRLRSKFEEFNI